MQRASTRTPASDSPPATITISGISHDGRGIGFLPENHPGKGMAVFVPGALPGQKILCSITRRAKNFLEAETREILEEREDLRQPHCPHWQICGGCPLQRLDYGEQLTLKREILKNALQRIGHFEASELERLCQPTLASPLLAAFRNKVEFAIGGRENPAPGFRKQGSHEVFPLENCAAIASPAISIAKEFAGIIRESGLPGYEAGRGFWRFLTLRETGGANPGWIAICLTSRGDGKTRRKAREAGEKLLANSPGLRAFIHEERHKKDCLAIGEKRIATLGRDGDNPRDAAILTRHLAGVDFQLDAASFFQVNGSASEILAKAVLDMADGGETLLDLYSGAGAPGLLLAPRFSNAIFVEADKKAAQWIFRNARALKLENCEIHTGDAADFPKYLRGKAVDLCLLDPPRQGISARAMAALSQSAPERIIYVSCNPATFARDASILKQAYKLARLKSIDLFPHTPHVETVALWTKKAD